MKRYLITLLAALALPTAVNAQDFTELEPFNPHSYKKSSLVKWENDGRRYLTFKGTTRTFDCFARTTGEELCSGRYTHFPDRFYERNKTSIIDFKDWKTVLFEYDVDCIDKTYDRKGDSTKWTKIVMDQTPFLVAQKYCSPEEWSKLPNK